MGLSDYEVRETIATSPRSVVRRAIRRTDGAPVVLKSLSEDFSSLEDLRRLEFEYRILKKLAVAGVIRALAFEKSGSEAMLVLEDFGGKHIPQGPDALSIREFLEIAVQLAEALGRVHDKNVIHKDLKPKNLLFNPATRELKLIDFHVASELSRERQDIWNAAQLLGSLPYISPEQTGRTNRELDYRTDYYSLGVTLFELLTGRLPFDAGDAMAWAHCHLSKRPLSASQVRSDVPPMLAEIIGKLMAKDPDQRYQSAKGLVTDLRACVRQLEDASAPLRFPLGSADVSEKFQVPQKLFGREREIQTLLEVFERASAGRAELLLVSGYSGIGKSSLIQEVHRSLGAKNGYFVSGKFDQLERNVPYGAFVQALRKLVKQLLSEPDQRLQAWKRRITEALGANGRVMVDLVPELEQVIGPQPPLPDVPPAEAQHRFKHVFREFIKVFARAEHPLVVFLDDLQWVDASTPELLIDLFSAADVRHLLLIGAYRDNEVHPGHALTAALNAIRTARADAVQELVLEPLRPSAIRQLLSQTLRRPEEDVGALTEVIFSKTDGNPFFTNELLGSLYEAGAFPFDPDEGRFGCDLEKVRHAAIADDIVELLVQRLRRLPADTTAVLRVAACVGTEFDLGTLARILERPPGQVARALWDAIVERVIVPLDGRYRLLSEEDSVVTERHASVRYQFQHDRVQQAAYSLIAPHERERVHLEIGRLSLRELTAPEQDDRIFDVVNHLNLGVALIESPAERSRLAELNLSAGRRAKQAAAYAIAARYLSKSAELLSDAEWAQDPERRFAVMRERAECVFLAGEVDRALELTDRLLPLAPSRQAQGSVYFLRTRIVEHQGKLLEAVATIRRGLALFGVSLPEDPAAIDRGIADGIAKMQAHLARVPVERLATLPEMSDPDKVMTMNLLFQVIPPAIQTYPPLFILVELLMFDLALTHGTTAVSCKNFVDCGIIQSGILGDPQVAYRLGHAAFELLQRYVPTPLETAVHFVFGGFVSHWRAHHAEGMQAYERAQRLGIETGDIQHAAYAAVHRMHRYFSIGRNLEECRAENEAGVAFIQRLHAQGQLVGALVAVRAVARLLGSDGSEQAAERADQEAVQTIESAGNAQWTYSFGQAMTMVSVLLGDLDAAERWQRFTEPVALAGNCLFSVADYHLFRALCLTRRFRTLSESERAAALEAIAESRDKLQLWAENSPDNFAHKKELLAAEIARIEGRPLEEVLDGYERAARATGNDFIQLRALAHEYQGELWLERGYPRFAKPALREAYQLYAEWGARAKLRALEERYPGWFSADDAVARTHATTGAGLASSLDVASVLKATQAISSEVRSARLFAALMDTIIENAGAERGCLVLRDEDDQRFYVEAWASVESQATEEMRSIPLEAASNVCADVVRFVARTRETLVLDDARERGGFEHDPYVQAHGVRSVLCVPVLDQGVLVAVLYAENNTAPQVFTQERLAILKVIASQAAISLTNAKLYNALERKVEERTREIAKKSRELSAVLDGMEQGVFTIDADLRIQPPYSRHLEQILGTRTIAGQPFVPLLFRGANVSRQAISAMEAALRFTFGVPRALAGINASHWVTEFQRGDGPECRSFQVDWSIIVDEQDRVEKILVAVRDVTELRRLTETAARKTRELDIVGQILDAGVENFRELAGTAARLLESGRERLARRGDRRELLDALFRDLHTIKGNARVLRFGPIVEAAHAAEETLEALRRAPDASWDPSVLQRSLDEVAARLAEYAEVCDRKLAPLATRRSARLERELEAIEHIASEASGSAEDAAARLAEIRSAVARARAVPFVELVQQTARLVPSLASELDRPAPIVACDHAGFSLTPAWARVLRDVLVQCFRNSVAHGIEGPDERAAASKDARGHIRVQLERRNGALRLHVSDDGRGLAVDELRRCSGDPDASDERVAEAAFAAGVSLATEVSPVAGRGVGLDVVRTSVRRAGGDVAIVFTGGKRGGRRPFELVVTLPEDAVISCA